MIQKEWCFQLILNYQPTKLRQLVSVMVVVGSMRDDQKLCQTLQWTNPSQLQANQAKDSQGQGVATGQRNDPHERREF